jgi:hypothetical protein
MINYHGAPQIAYVFSLLKYDNFFEKPTII